MASSTPKQVTNGNVTNNGPLGKRKKNRSAKGSYLNKWLDKTMSHIQESSPSMDTYGSIVNPTLNWQNSQFAPGFDPCRFNLYACATEPMSLPTLPTYYNPAAFAPCPEFRFVHSENKSVQVQRPRQRRRSDHKAEEVPGTPLGNHSPSGTLKVSYLQHKHYSDSQDYASLPPIVTSVGDTTSTSDMNNEKDNGCRRYSDPCVQGLPDVARPANGDAHSESGDSSDESGSHVGSRLLACLLDQISTLKQANERLNKDLQETKAELSSVRQQNAIWQKGSTASSLGGTPNHSMLNNNGQYTTGYAPGLLSDIVREIRDAARLREEAMYSRLRTMMHERTENGLTSTDAKYSSERSLDDIKSSLRASEVDKRRMLLRISKLEEELRTLRVTNGLDPALNGQANGGEETDLELQRLRRECTDMRRAKQAAEDQSHKLEVLVTQLRSKFKTQVSPNGPESIPSDAEHDPNHRVRRTSVNSTSNSTVVFGPVTDL